MLAFVVLFFTIAFFTSDLRIRYIGPIIPVLVVLSVLGIQKIHRAIWERRPGGKTNVAFVYNGRYVVAQFKEVEPFGYISGEVSRDEYLDRHRPEYAAMRFINKYLPQDARVMLIFLGSRGYYCDRNYVYGDEALNSIFLMSENGRDIRSKLKNMGITHLLIYDPLFGRWASDNLKEKAGRSLKAFFLNYAKVIYSQNGFSVFVLENVSS